MFKNYFLLNRHVLEVNEILSDSTLINAFTQEKDKLIFCLKKGSQEYFIELNADSSLPYFIIRDKYNRAKKNTLDFFESYLPSNLISVKIAELDRVIQFNLHSASIYFYIHGKETNVFLIHDENKIEPFKKIEDDQKLIDEIRKIKFTNLFLLPELNLDSKETSSTQISKKYRYLGREIAEEFIKRSSIDVREPTGIILQKIIKEIETEKPFVFRDESTGEIKLSFFNKDGLLYNEIEYFNTLNEALKYFISKEHKHKHENTIGKEIENKFEKKINQLVKKRDQLQKRMNEGCKDQKYKQIGSLLMMNIEKINKNTIKVELENIYDSNKIISVDLIPKLSLRENVNYYFEKAKSERKEFDKLKELLIDTDGEIKKQTLAYDEMKNTNATNNAKHSLKTVLQKKDEKHSSQNIKTKFRQFILFDKYLIFVGKNSKNNDELTNGFAKQNDYWFHARSVSGSHVVLRYDKSHGDIQKNIFEKTASVAAFYSKAKTSGLVPVSYTQKKYVIKRKGMEPGKVLLLKEKVLIVRPEIPKECKLITEE